MTQETNDVVARWSLQFSNIPPHVAIWSAKPGHDPRRDCVALLEDGADRHTIGEAFEALTVCHNRELQSQSARIAELEGLLEPFANLADANMNDPLRKWLTVAHIQNAARASLTKDSTSAPG